MQPSSLFGFLYILLKISTECAGQPDPKGCRKPVFQDSEGKITFEQCENQNFHLACSKYLPMVPVGWTAALVCTTANYVFKFSSACRVNGAWSPPFPNRCTELIPKTPSPPQTPSSSSNAAAVPVKTKSPCEKRPAWQRLVDSFPRYALSCLFPGRVDETANCGSDSFLVSGTTAYIKCRAPWVPRNNKRPNSWVCEDGNWIGSQELVGCEIDGDSTTTTKTPIITVTTTTTTSPPLVFDAPTVSPSRLPSPPPVVFDPTTASPSQFLPSPPLNEPFVSQNKANCPALSVQQDGVLLQCSFKDTLINCSQFAPAGTEAKFSCAELYESAYILPTMYRICKEDGTWSGSKEQFVCRIKCGIHGLVSIPLISFGFASTRGRWPWHAALFSDGEIPRAKWNYICGGTLVGQKAIVTAAHCVTHPYTTVALKNTALRVDLGKYRREMVDDFVQVREVEEIIVHPSYSPRAGYDADIAVVVLRQKVETTVYVRPACFPFEPESPLEELHLSPNSNGTVVGWGLDEKGDLTDIMQEANLPVAGVSECTEALQKASLLGISSRPTVFCAGSGNKTNVCSGDSGGGMFFPFKQSGVTRWYLQGLVSVGIPDEFRNCDPSKYSIFTRVGRYARWIVRNLSEYDAL